MSDIRDEHLEMKIIEKKKQLEKGKIVQLNADRFDKFWQ